MADIQKGSTYMAGIDKAASAIEAILNDQIAAVIDEVHADGTISNARAIELKKRAASVGAKVVSLVVGYHGVLVDAAQAASIDLPPIGDGQTEFVAVMSSLVEPLSGGR